MKQRYILWFLGLGILMSCSEAININAPYKDIWAVYGVLNPQEDYQFIRISKSFQPEENAFNYAANNDLTVGGLDVRIIGGGKTYHAVQVDSVLKDTTEGDFAPYMRLYKIETINDAKLKEEEIYRLEIRNPDNRDFLLQAHTRIPPRPRITAPVTSLSRGRKCLPVVSFEDSVYIYFNRYRGEVSTYAMRFEIQFRLNYWKNGVKTVFKTRPTKLFNDDVGCLQTGDNAICYKFGRGIALGRMKPAFADSSASYIYDAVPVCGNQWDDLAKFVEIQVTALDTVLSKYIISNDPAYVNLNTVRREFTNISGTEDAVGLFGSVAADVEAVTMSPCSEYLLGLNPNWGPDICD